jgi:hypothetical protein
MPTKSDDRFRRYLNGKEQADILRLENLPPAELRERARMAWEAYLEKHLALRAGDDMQIRVLEQMGSEAALWSKQSLDAVELARVLTTLWLKGDSWEPDGPILVPAAR